MRRIDHIVVHCAATPEGRDVKAKDIERWHRAQGYSDIGYHYVVCLDGTIQKGRPEQTPGVHVRGHNAHSLGVVYIGGTTADKKPKDTRTPEQKRSLRKLLKELKDKYPQAQILGHRDFPGVKKDCPCFNAKEEYLNL